MPIKDACGRPLLAIGEQPRVLVKPCVAQARENASPLVGMSSEWTLNEGREEAEDRQRGQRAEPDQGESPQRLRLLRCDKGGRFSRTGDCLSDRHGRTNLSGSTQ